MEFIDSHIHFWDLANKINSWVNQSTANTALIKNYLPDDVYKNTINAKLCGVVHIEAHDSSIPTITEIKWLSSIMQQHPELLYAHIAFADITLPLEQFSVIIDQIKQYPQVKGIRHILAHHPYYKYNPCSEDLTKHPNILANLNYLTKNNLIFDCQMYPYQLDNFLPLIIDSKVTCIIDHMALPAWDNQKDHDMWQQVILNLTKIDNLFVKLSGLIMFQEQNQFKKIVQFCLDHISADKLLYGSNYPVSFTNDDNLWRNFLNEMIISEIDKEKIFYSNAKQLFFS